MSCLGLNTPRSLIFYFENFYADFSTMDADGTASGAVTAEDRADAETFLTYIDATPTPFHLVRETATRCVFLSHTHT